MFHRRLFVALAAAALAPITGEGPGSGEGG